MPSPFLASDISPFVALAQAEEWICGRWELEFLLQQFPQGCLALRDGGDTLGYITSVRHANSGWIGNLLVRPEARRRGIGRLLMEGALAALLSEGVETVWLTASAKGAGLYQKLGFVAIDSVNRWVGEGRGDVTPTASSLQPDLEAVKKIDQAGWGDRRDALLEKTCSRGELYQAQSAFICRQSWKEGMQLGPWGAHLQSQAETQLDLALSGVQGRAFLDVPAANVAAASLLTKRGFTIKGSNLLMHLGTAPQYDPKKVYSLASMGSMG